MATITSAGIASGLDVNSLVSQLMQVESRPLTLLTNKQSAFNSKISALGSISGAFSSLQTAALALSKASTFKATASDTAVLSASVTGTVTAGNYSVTVDRLAEYGKVATNATGWSADDTDVTNFQSGTLTITMGTIDDNEVASGARNGSNWDFTTNQNSDGHNSTFTVNFTGGSLQDLRDAINSATDADGNAIGVTAQIVSGQSGSQLVLTSKDQGMDQAFTISGTLHESVGNADHDFSYDPRNATNPSLREVSIPWSAKMTVDGITATSTSNIFTDVVPGLSITAAKLGSSTLTVAKDLEASKTAIQAFVDAYNKLRSAIKTNTAYDATNKKASPLTGDFTVRGITQALSNALSSTPTGVSGSFSRLSEVGISIDASGTMSLDSSKLDAALTKDNASVQALLGAYGKSVDTVAKTYVGSSGIISSRTTSLTSMIRLLDDQKTALNTRLTAIQARYQKQFSSLDSIVSGMQSTSSFLSKQFA